MVTGLTYLWGKRYTFLVYFALLVAYYLAILLLTRDRPIFSLDKLHVAFPNKTLNSTITIDFDLRIGNKNIFIGLYYTDPLDLTFKYFLPAIRTEKTNVTIGKYTIQGFYQGSSDVKHIHDVVVVQDIFCGDANDKQPAKVVVLRVDLEGRVEFRSIENKKLHLVAGASVVVNFNTGNIVDDKTVELEYTSGSDLWGFLQWLMLLPWTLLLLMIVLAGFFMCTVIIKLSCSLV